MLQHDVASHPEVKEISAQADQLVTTFSSFRIVTAEDYSLSGSQLKQVKDAQKKLDTLRKSITRPIDAAKAAVMDLFRAPESKLNQAETSIKRAMVAFQQEQQRLRAEEQRKADEAARKEREKLEAQAAKATASGKVEKAEQLEQRAATVVAPVIQREAPKVAGINTREVWKAECTDLKALVKAIAEGRAPLSLVIANDKVIGAQARSLKGDFVCDGIRVWSEQSIAAGAA
jgi:ATP-dependent Clp protease ATP-binding subunit ClpA